MLWAFDCILTDLAVQQGGGAKGGKKGGQHTSSKSQVNFENFSRFELLICAHATR